LLFLAHASSYRIVDPRNRHFFCEMIDTGCKSSENERFNQVRSPRNTGAAELRAALTARGVGCLIACAG